PAAQARRAAATSATTDRPEVLARARGVATTTAAPPEQVPGRPGAPPPAGPDGDREALAGAPTSAPTGPGRRRPGPAPVRAAPAHGAPTVVPTAAGALRRLGRGDPTRVPGATAT